jgi:FkbM family methyltransferase
MSNMNRLKARALITYRKLTRPKIISIAGIRIPVDEEASGGLLNALYGGYYENHELSLVKSVLQQDDVVMELGTGIGLLSAYCAAKIGSERVFTYEANPSLKEKIHSTYSLNHVSPAVEFCILGDRHGEHTFYPSKNFWASSTIQRNSRNQAIKVPMKSFNQEVQRINPTFLLMDIEGGEYDLMQYADLHNIRKLQMELHRGFIGEEKANFVLSKLRESGFQVNQELSYKDNLLLER